MTAAPHTRDIAAVVLGGGQSRRFGREKGLAEWRGTSLVDHVLQRLPQPRAGTLLALRAEQHQAWSGREDTFIVHDHDAHAGPLRGVVRGLEHLAATTNTQWAWIIACDQPLVCTPLLAALATKAGPGTLAVIPQWEGREQPLNGLYHVDIAPRLRVLHDGGEASLLRALDAVGYQTFTADECRRHDPRGLGFRNVNRPGDLDELERILK